MSSPDQLKDQHTVEAEAGNDSPASPPSKPGRKWIRYAVIGGVLVAAAVIAIIVVFTTQSSDNDIARTPFTFEQVLASPDFVPLRPNGTWHDTDTILQRNTAGDLTLFNVTDGSARILLSAAHPALNGSHSQQLSADGRFLLLSHVQETLFRHSFRSTYQVLEISAGVVIESSTPRYISQDGSATPLDYALFGPVGSQLVFVQAHDLFYQVAADASSPVVRITDTGSATVFNALCDWVYEEEIFGRSDAVWFGPRGERLVFAQFDDTAVHNVTMWHWGETKTGGPLSAQYPDATHISYPKVGTVNPQVRLYEVQLTAATQVRLVELPPSAELVVESNGEPPVLTAVDLTADERVVAVWMNRAQNRAFVEVCEKSEAVAKCATHLRFTSTTGWLQLSEPLFLAGDRIAIVQPVDQSMQIVTHSLSTAAGQPETPRQLLIAGVHVERLLFWDSADDVYFCVGNNASHTEERQLYAVYGKAASNNSVHCLTCGLQPEYNHFDARFGDDGGHYVVLESQGPGVPRHDLYEWSPATPGVWTHRRVLQTNEKLVELLRGVAQASVEHSVVKLSSEGAGEASVRLMLPPDYGKTNRTYPLLVYVYAGPGTFAGSSAWQLSWNAFMASNRSVVVAQIDGRGTARRDLRHLHAVYRQLGQFEVADQIDVTRQLTKSLKFVDAERVGVWGHSYGGYATGMVMATDTDRVFRCGASVAPVTDWMYYDSLYTERYMGLASDNADGYRKGSLLEHALGLRDKKYYLVHGTGDDNVHFQMSMELARELELADVEFEQMSYPNEAHSLAGVRSYHFDHMTKFFDRCFQG